jgi:DNA helicase-2/ATP-dependent DNA helicase PcrA
VEVREGAVQILTVHAAKGLEWEIVAVAGLTKDVFPGRVSAADHYLHGPGSLPFPLRGDHAGLPELRLAGAADQKGVMAAVTRFKEEWSAHDEREERRLAYVAVTRPRRLLLCSGAWWSEQTKRPRGPSPFLAEIRDACADGVGEVDQWYPPPADDATNPLNDLIAQANWPTDYLGTRRPALESAAALVRAARAAPPHPRDGDDEPDDVVRRWAEDVRLLLAERATFVPDPRAPVAVALPGHLSVSQLVALRRDPQGLARSLRRPLPARPDPHTRRGTAFHAWLERRYGADRLLDIEELPGAADEEAAPDAVLDELKERFLASEWGDRMPVEVEVAFSTTVAGVVIRGRMDAVFADPDGGFDVVDWKTGRRPTGRDADAAAIQLAAYRLAWAQLAGVEVGRVRAAFHYVREGGTVRPADLLDEAGLTALVARLPAG